MPKVVKRKKKKAAKQPERHWDLKRDGLTQSLLHDWLVCPERFRIKAFLGWEEDRGFDPKIEFGSMVHVGLEERAENGWNATKVANAIKRYSNKLCKDHPDDVDDIRMWNEMATRIMQVYHSVWRVRDAKYDVIQTEQVFRQDYRLPSGRVIPLRGMMDGVIRRKDESIWLLEHKCKGRVDLEAMRSTLHKNLQVTFYTQVLRLMMPEETISGCVYDVIQRPLASSRMLKGETRHGYVDRGIRKAEEEISKHFMRWDVQLMPQELDEAKTTILDPILERFMDWYEWVAEDPEHPFRKGNRVHFLKPYGIFDGCDWGTRGPFYDLITTGSKIGLRKVENMFPELS